MIFSIAMLEDYRRYPIGIQNFQQLRNNDCVYVDKTELVYRLTHTDRVYFQGKKDLFGGLAMERWEKDWESYLVLHIDFSLTKYMELTDLTGQLNLFLHRWEKIYGKDEAEKTASERLQGIILRASEQIGKQVVVLIDEYDAPLLDSNSDTALQQQLRNEMRKFFSPPQEVGAVSSLSLHHRHQQVQPTEHLQRTE